MELSTNKMRVVANLEEGNQHSIPRRSGTGGLMPIKAILQSIYSKRDRNGNCYWGFRFTDTATGKSVEGTVSGGESNVRSMLRPLGLESSEVHSSIIELPIREWNALTKEFRRAGCTAEQLAAFVRAELDGKA